MEGRPTDDAELFTRAQRGEKAAYEACRQPRPHPGREPGLRAQRFVHDRGAVVCKPELADDVWC